MSRRFARDVGMGVAVGEVVARSPFVWFFFDFACSCPPILLSQNVCVSIPLAFFHLVVPASLLGFEILAGPLCPPAAASLICRDLIVPFVVGGSDACTIVEEGGHWLMRLVRGGGASDWSRGEANGRENYLCTCGHADQ
jgi:hypothetical protein